MATLSLPVANKGDRIMLTSILRRRYSFACVAAALVLGVHGVHSSGNSRMHQDAVPRVVDPGPIGGPPSDAIVLFDGKSLDKFRGQNSPEPQWKLENGVMETTPRGGIFS